MYEGRARPVSLSVAERAAEEVLSLPVHPELAAADRRVVCETIAAHYDTR
ncbi:MAG: hypothetical protein U5K37_00775 [Natrialbaceae archaeon]|nr:hypothetical protein [Natrialbaceae archaeon]